MLKIRNRGYEKLDTQPAEAHRRFGNVAPAQVVLSPTSLSKPAPLETLQSCDNLPLQVQALREALRGIGSDLFICNAKPEDAVAGVP